MTELLNKIKRALENATPAPWYTDGYDIEYDPFKDDHEKKEKTLGNIAKLANAYNPNKNHANDAELICLLRNEVSSLITTIESQASQLNTCKEAIEAITEDHRNQKEKSDDWIQKVEAEARGYMLQTQSQKEEIKKLESQIDEMEQQMIIDIEQDELHRD